MVSRSEPEFATPAGNRYPGYRLGLPRDGAGSIAGAGRRIAGLLVDWAIASAVSAAAFEWHPVATLAVFSVLRALSIALFGGSPGHLVCGMGLTTVSGHRPGVWRPVVRELLVALVVPMLVWDTDHRGGHDLVSGLVLRRTGGGEVA